MGSTHASAIQRGTSRRALAIPNVAAMAGSVVLWLLASVLVPVGASAAGTVPETYASVADMQAHQPFYIAHRGGSADWPEMSLAAYSNAAAWGAGAIEVSVARTKDGEYFGLHDATLDRTSLTRGAVDPRTLTWAELTTTYRNKLNATASDGEPYAALSQIFAAHAGRRVIFVDTKYIGADAHRDELIDLMLSYAPAQTWVLKGYYDDAELAMLARDAGVTSWGYYYARDLDEFAATSSRWDMLGLEVDATRAQWAEVTATGKPSIAFMIANRQDLADAFAKGADAMMTTSIPTVFGSPRVVHVPDPPPAVVPTAPPTGASAPRPLVKRCKVFKPVVKGKRYKVRRCVTGKWTPSKTRAQRAKALKIAKAKYRARTLARR